MAQTDRGLPAQGVELVDGGFNELVAQQPRLGGEEEVEDLIEQSLEIQLAAAGGTADQVVQPLPTEDVAVEQHFLEAVAQLRVRVLHQPAGEIGVGRTQDFEIGIDA